MHEYLPFFQQQAADVMMIDVPWNGFSQSKKVGDLAEVFQINISPHNYYSHLSSFISASLCATSAQCAELWRLTSTTYRGKMSWSQAYRRSSTVT